MKRVARPNLSNEEVYRAGKKETWLLDTSFEWFSGHADVNEGLVTLTNTSPYELRDANTWKAFRELASCISNPGLIYKQDEMRDDYKHRLDHSPWNWIYSLYPKNEISGQDLHNLLNWLSKYGFPYPDDTPYRYVVKDDKSSRMKLDDIVVIATLVSLAWNLFESSRTRDGKVIRDLASLIFIHHGSKRKSPFLTFGVVELAPKEMCIRFEDSNTELNIDDWTQDTWRKVINLWIGRISESFINVKIENRFTQEIRIRPVLTATSFSSWLWLHFLTHIGEAEGATNTKVCRDCGTEYTGSRSVRCPACNLEHKNKLKYQWASKPKTNKHK